MASKKAAVGYIDGFVIPLPKKNLNAYKKQAILARTVWMEYGALEYRECISEDVNVSFGLPFPKLAKIKKGEVVVFAWISYKSKAHRNKVNKQVMKDERLSCLHGTAMPFDMKKMTYGGFKVLVKE